VKRSSRLLKIYLYRVPVSIKQETAFMQIALGLKGVFGLSIALISF
jgi:hypothetical protein